MGDGLVPLLYFLEFSLYLLILLLGGIGEHTLDVLTRCLHGAVLRNKLLSTDSALLIPHLPCNLYGPGDNYDEQNGHLAAGVIRRLHKAKVNGDKHFIVWGTGKPRREFVYIDDMADAAIHVMNVDKSLMGFSASLGRIHVEPKNTNFFTPCSYA